MEEKEDEKGEEKEEKEEEKEEKEEKEEGGGEGGEGGGRREGQYHKFDINFVTCNLCLEKSALTCTEAGARASAAKRAP